VPPSDTLAMNEKIARPQVTYQCRAEAHQTNSTKIANLLVFTLKWRSQ